MTKGIPKLRVLHSAALLSPSSGMLAQMELEQSAVANLDVDWKVRMYCPKNNPHNVAIQHYDNFIDSAKLNTFWGKAVKWFGLRFNYYRWLLHQQNNFDIFLLRYYVHDPLQFIFTLLCKKPIYFVHHTLEVPELALEGGLKGFIRSRLEAIIGPLAISKASGIIGVTKEIVNYELQRSGCFGKSKYIYPNGILIENNYLEDKRGSVVPEFIFVANFAPWHGLDILLNNVSSSKDEFILHLVGKIPTDLLKLTLDPRIKLHGALSHADILNLSSRCWVGLASFALYRNKMTQACPLKTREYLSLGLPVYGNYQDVFPDDAHYFKIGDGNVAELIAFARKTRIYSKKRIVEDSRLYIEKTELIKGLVKYLSRN